MEIIPGEEAKVAAVAVTHQGGAAVLRADRLEASPVTARKLQEKAKQKNEG